MTLHRVSTELGARMLLQRLVDSGKCVLEDFDSPPPDHLNPDSYRNLLRDPGPIEAVEISDPRDFTPATSTAGTPANAVPDPNEPF